MPAGRRCWPAARPEAARLVVLALPDAAESRRVLELLRAANPGIQAAARAHDDATGRCCWPPRPGGLAVMGEREIALGIADFAMRRLGVEVAAAQADGGCPAGGPAGGAEPLRHAGHGAKLSGAIVGQRSWQAVPAQAALDPSGGSKQWTA